MRAEEEKSHLKVIQVDETQLKKDLSELVRGSVEETLNALLDAEADKLCQASKYERNPDRVSTRAGSYNRNFETKAGKVKLKVPKLRTIPFESAIIERYKRRESSVEEALMEMYLAGVSVRRVEDITESLWGTKVSPSTISKLNQKVFVQIDEWRIRTLTEEYPYVYLDGLYLKKSWGGEVRNVAILVAIGVNSEGYREVLGSMEGAREDKDSWQSFLKHLKDRGLKGVNLIISDKCLGLVESIPYFFPESKWQRCVVHFYRNVFGKAPRSSFKVISQMLKAIHSQENKEEALKKANFVVERLMEMKLKEAAKVISDGIEETLAYMDFPSEHWRKIRTNNPLERIIKEIKRRTKVVGAFPDGKSALMLATARLRHVASTKWGTKKYVDMDKLKELKISKLTA
ncbi:IS256 family transposase [Leptospira yasudae]|uniref:Mutator family transposase n=1 Tax=Leptospira yasudae TaxID=2202201 RepID=A0ABX9LX15_9LEPT|nr:IS256 family transposase [Leptospira yasudae]RHX77393.1 IS256 family transposase [Leptospira yasudae]TGK23090.1 IS256 family transposase [Leptospira yasudae]TGM06058.1 IS256 family transposase [Leptospira yasudae]